MVATTCMCRIFPQLPQVAKIQFSVGA